MKTIPYLMMDGNCEQAIKFYQETLDAKLMTIMRYKDAKLMGGADFDEKDALKVMHCSLEFAGNTIYMSDALQIHDRPKPGNIEITLEFESYEDQVDTYNRLSERGQVIMPLQDTFWGASFAKIIDKFGIPWSLNFTKILE